MYIILNFIQIESQSIPTRTPYGTKSQRDTFYSTKSLEDLHYGLGLTPIKANIIQDRIAPALTQWD